MSQVMNVAVMKFKNVPGSSPDAPAEYPAKVKILGSSTTLPDASGKWELMTIEQLGNLQISLNTQYKAYLTKMAVQAKIKEKIMSAMDFGQSMMAEYGSRNVYAGRSVADIKAISTKLAVVQSLLLSGSLYAAIDEVTNLTPDALVSQADKDYFLGKLKTYLGII